MDYLSLNSAWNLHWLDAQYQAWENNPASIYPPWDRVFSRIEKEKPHSKTRSPVVPNPSEASPARDLDLELFKILAAYRQQGHLKAQFNPLLPPPPASLALSLEGLGLKEEDLKSNPLLAKTLKALETTYCGPLGYVYTHIQDKERRKWLQTAIETQRFAPNLDKALSCRLLEYILEAEALEDALDAKFRSQKRFSLEGLISLIPGLRELFNLSAEGGIQQVFIAASHRGRINLLANVLQKPLERIFEEFIDQKAEKRGDVKYHLGWESEWKTFSGKTINLYLSPNPSHLEAIYPVLLGKVRAWQDTHASKASLAIVLHGEAAFVGQGIVAETLNMSQLKGYSTQGTLHVILNNQIGFTTLPSQGRSSLYSGDLAKVIDAPLLLVNSEKIEAVLEAFSLAFAYRQTFGKDIFIELYGYRKGGHNEIDEPSFTQPQLYPGLSQRPRLSTLFLDHFSGLGINLDSEKTALHQAYTQNIEGAYAKALNQEHTPGRPSIFVPHEIRYSSFSAAKKISEENLGQVAKALWEIPPGFNLHPKLAKQLEAKKKAFPHAIDWSMAEALALGTLLQEGFSIRLTGQDSERGTFSQRQAIWHDVATGRTHCPLASLSKGRAVVAIHNSPLSEAAALGFEYGYSTFAPPCLTLWEAQFGDFVNGAQVMIDQFLSSAESKWGLRSRLVLLLPHGHQGQGPDHSSARIERFLQACAEDNLHVCYPTTPAQYFHVLRRQMHQSQAKPLVLFIPKNLFRHKDCVSPLGDFSEGSFKPFLTALEPSYPAKQASPQALFLCSGKIYYELLSYGQERGLSVPIIRLEQLYPLDIELLEKHLAAYAPSTPLLWIQEEPKNRGAWSYIAPLLAERQRPLHYIGRPASASVACGSVSQHQIEQVELLSRAYG